MNGRDWGMNRVIFDDDFERWEVFATAGRSGLGGTSRLVFRCRTNPALPPRGIELDVGTEETEREVLSRGTDELQELFRQARTID